MTKLHDYGTTGTPRQRGKNSNKYQPDPPELSIVKVDASSVPYGMEASRNGSTVWAAYHNGEFVAVGATADEARRMFYAWFNRTYRGAKGMAST
jgi:hypothetical protein